MHSASNRGACRVTRFVIALRAGRSFHLNGKTYTTPTRHHRKHKARRDGRAKYLIGLVAGERNLTQRHIRIS
jgi:hypothetical protein